MEDLNKKGNDFSYGDSTGSGSTGTAAARMKEQVLDTASDAKDKIADFGRQTINKINDSRPSAAGVLDQTATTLHSSGEKLSGVAHSAADSIQATANYVRNTDVKGMANDVQDLCRRYPGQSLAVAAILGFLVARGLRGQN
jgi:ElaB/YqjD/DUF883 family membrane-anchored ribosome-binding protein